MEEKYDETTDAEQIDMNGETQKAYQSVEETSREETVEIIPPGKTETLNIER